jgi:hypothetical protein
LVVLCGGPGDEQGELPARGFLPSAVVVVICDWRCGSGVGLAASLMVVWWDFASSGVSVLESGVHCVQFQVAVLVFGDGGVSLLRRQFRWGSVLMVMR